MTITQLREPLKSWFAEFDKFQVGVSSGGDRVVINAYNVILPTMDPEDARALSAELHAVMAPVIQRFATRKLEQFLKAAEIVTTTKLG